MASPKFLRAVSGMVFVLMVIAGCASPTVIPETLDLSTNTVPTSAPASPTITQEPQPTDTSAPEPTATSTSTPEPAATDTPMPEPSSTAEEATWAADGVILENEYTYQEDFSGLRLWWTNDATYLYFAVEGDTSGWVAVGFDPERRMQGANFLFGYISEDGISLWDAYGTAPTGPNHPPDEDLGGTVDIITSAGVEENGVTRFEIQIPLDSGDAYDKVLEPGQTYPFIIAMGSEDSFNAYSFEGRGRATGSRLMVVLRIVRYSCCVSATLD